MVYRRGINRGWVCSAWHLKRRLIRAGRLRANGTTEHFNRTLLTEWAYDVHGPATAYADVALTNSFAAPTRNEAIASSAGNHQSADSPPENNISVHHTWAEGSAAEVWSV